MYTLSLQEVIDLVRLLRRVNKERFLGAGLLRVLCALEIQLDSEGIVVKKEV